MFPVSKFGVVVESADVMSCEVRLLRIFTRTVIGQWWSVVLSEMSIKQEYTVGFVTTATND